MYNLDDKDLDRLSKTAAENYNAPGVPSWDSLQQKLDLEIPQKKDKRRRLLLLSLLGLLCGSGGIFWFSLQKNVPLQQSQSIASPKNVTAVDKTNTVPLQDALVPGTRNKNTADNRASNRAVDLTKKQKSPGSTLQTKRNISSTTDNIAGEYGHQPKRVEAKKEVAAPTIAPNDKNQSYLTGPIYNSSGSPKKNRTKNTNTPPAVYESNPKSNKAQNDIAIISDDDKFGKSPVATPQPPLKAAVTADTSPAVSNNNRSIPSKAGPVQTNDLVKEDPQKKKISKRERALSAAILMGADISTVKFTHVQNLGFNIGLLGGYHFSNNWSVHTGIIYTKKNYSAFGYDFHPPQPYTNSNILSLDGDCYMWELPLLVRYTFDSKSGHHYYVSTGLSSYFMKKEHYTYNLKPGNYPATYDWTSKDPRNYPFSILHISAGIEKKMGKYLNWQIEPFAKIPLQGIGYGKLNLNSFGINFLLQIKKPLHK